MAHDLSASLRNVATLLVRGEVGPHAELLVAAADALDALVERAAADTDREPAEKDPAEEPAPTHRASRKRRHE